MAIDYAAIERDFAVPAGATRTEDNDWMYKGRIWDPVDQYKQSLNTGTSFGYLPEDQARLQSIADFNGMSLEEWFAAGMGPSKTSTDKYGSTIRTPTSGKVDYGSFAGYNPKDFNDMAWILPLMLAGAGAWDMGLFSGATASGGGAFGGDIAGTALAGEVGQAAAATGATSGAGVFGGDIAGTAVAGEAGSAVGGASILGNTPPGSTSLIQRLFGEGKLKDDDYWRLLSTGLNVGSAALGTKKAGDISEIGKDAAARADPFGTSGGRALADQQLQALMRDPSQVAANDPAYKLRIQAAQRAMASMGQQSGAMAVAGANASTDWYNQRLQQLGQLAGAGLNPAQAGQLQLSAETASADYLSKALATLGYTMKDLANDDIKQEILKKLGLG